jgi:riboflavin biosynthesis pyrimidine reductase
MQNPIVCCSRSAASAISSDDDVDILPCNKNSDGSLDISHVLEQLRCSYGIDSILVEGGSAVISSFLSLGLVDCLVITVSPKLIGQEFGIPSVVSVPVLPWIDILNEHAFFVPLGVDCIFVSPFKQ